MNNSGETETYKYSGYSTSVSYGEGNSSIKSTNANNSLGDYSISLGDGALAPVANQISIGQNANGGSDGTNTHSISIGTNSINQYNDTGNGGIAIGKEANANNFIRNCVSIGYRAKSAVGGVSIGDSANYGFDGDAQIAIGAFSISSAESCIAVGFNCDVRANNAVSVGSNSQLQTGTYSVNIGAENIITAERVVLIGAQQSVSSPYSTLINGVSNTLSSTGYYNNIFNGSGNTISGTTSGATMLSCSGRIADADNTTYVENLRVFGQAKYGNYNNGNTASTYTINWDNGNIQKITLTGATSFSANSITDGTTYILKVQQDAVGGRTATWSSQFKWSNGTAPTLSVGANAVDIITFVAMDGVLYGVAQKNFS
jgi:hypothetical protein